MEVLRPFSVARHLLLARWHVAGLLAAMLCFGHPATASYSTVCDRAAQLAARESGVPLKVLRSITRTETGRARGGVLEPWPWTVNMEGKGRWFPSEDEARAYVFHHFKRGARSFDVGCFQINYRWHGQAFRSIDQMFDPLENARYAARFLKSLHTEMGDWSRAAGAYHSRTPRYAQRYIARFDRILAALSDLTETGSAANDKNRVASTHGAARQSDAPRNTYPFLRSTSARRAPGSLVPLDGGAASLFARPESSDP